VPEIFPNSVRGRAMIVPVVTQWVTNALVVLSFPLAFNRVGKLTTFAFLACMATLQALFAWRLLPETKGKTLEEIEVYWSPERMWGVVLVQRLFLSTRPQEDRGLGQLANAQPVCSAISSKRLYFASRSEWRIDPFLN
jgi:hypothetical protein